MAISPEYKAYLESDEWKTKRLNVLRRAKFKCERCKKARAWQVHHLTYKHIFNEPLEDLQALCATCHRKVHGIGAKTVKRPFFRQLGKVLVRVIG